MCTLEVCVSNVRLVLEIVFKHVLQLNEKIMSIDEILRFDGTIMRQQIEKDELKVVEETNTTVYVGSLVANLHKILDDRKVLNSRKLGSCGEFSLLSLSPPELLASTSPPVCSFRP